MLAVASESTHRINLSNLAAALRIDQYKQLLSSAVLDVSHQVFGLVALISLPNLYLTNSKGSTPVTWTHILPVQFSSHSNDHLSLSKLFFNRNPIVYLLVAVYWCLTMSTFYLIEHRAGKPPPGLHLDVMKGDKLVEVCLDRKETLPPCCH